jgi:hypothetical protein
MPIPDDDDQFERYLKQFRPLAPEPLPVVQWHRSTRARALGLCALAAAIGVAAFAVLYPSINSGHLPTGKEGVSAVDPSPQVQRLTIGAANALLADAPSLKVALDGVAAQELKSQGIPLVNGKQSALTALGKEKTKL